MSVWSSQATTTSDPRSSLPSGSVALDVGIGLQPLLCGMAYLAAMKRHPVHTGRNDPLNQAFDRLERMLPATAAHVLHWLHAPESRYIRIPLGILCIIASFFWFLPVIGLEYLPIGLLLIAQDVPVMRKPVGRMMMRLLDVVDRVIRRWKAFRAAR
jgi:hypothetical protein